MNRLSGEELDTRLRGFLSEDIGGIDITTETTVPLGLRAEGELLAKSPCIVSGLSVARRTFELLDARLVWTSQREPGDRAEGGDVLVRLSGQAHAILMAERVALNLLQRMSGIATSTRRFVEAVQGTAASIFDTRKTAPGLRPFDRIAVVDGGGMNHRGSLAEMVLIKDNHRRLAGGVALALRAARDRVPAGVLIEVEVETEEELSEVAAAGADIILIDNQRPETVARWAEIARVLRPELSIEASGGIRLENVRAYAEAGANRISVGALTHSVEAADISLELVRGG